MSVITQSASAHPFGSSPTDLFSLSGRRHGRTAVITACGEIDVSTAACLKAAVTLAHEDGAEMILLDLSAVQFVDLHGLRAATRLADVEVPAVILIPGAGLTRVRAAVAAATEQRRATPDAAASRQVAPGTQRDSCRSNAPPRRGAERRRPGARP